MGYFPTFVKSYVQQRALVSFLKKSEYWTEQQWKTYQIQLLKKLVSHCYDHVLYYKNLFNKYDIKFGNINTVEDLRIIPFLSRELVKENINELKAKNYKESIFHRIKTSGTTEEPLSFYVNKDRWLANHFAYNRMFMHRGGYKRGKRTVSILGISNKTRLHRLLNTLELASLYLDHQYEYFLKKIEDCNPHFIVSYPSAIYFLAKFMLETNGTYSFDINAIFCHGEPVYPWQKETIEKAFHCRLFDIYGNGEKNAISATCEKSDLHHVFPNYCILELIDAKGNPVTTEGAIGEIVATGLQSFIFPFIRYKTGDVGVYTCETCACGRKYPMVKRIIGRINDGVVTNDNKIILSSKINHLISQHSNGVLKWQIKQERSGELQISLVLYNKTISKDSIKETIMKAFEETFSNEFELTFAFPISLQDDNTRKHRFLIQSLPVNLLNDHIF